MAQLVSTRNPLHSTRPLTVGVIPDAASLSLWSSMSPVQREATCDILELRLDTQKTNTIDNNPISLGRQTNCDLISGEISGQRRQ